MGKKMITLFLLLCLVPINGKENDVVDGSYTRPDKIHHLAVLKQISERQFEYNFLDMVFEIIADLPSNILGVKPYLFCPEIIFTLFLNDINNNMYQCDAPGFTSNTVTLVCQELKNIKSVTCPDRHKHFPPAFLKQQNNSDVLQANNNDGNSNFLLIFIMLSTILTLLVYLIYLQYKPKRVFNGDHESNPPAPPPPPPPLSAAYSQQNGVNLQYNPLPQNEVDETEEHTNSPAPNTLPNKRDETQYNGTSETLSEFIENPTKNSVDITGIEENKSVSEIRTSRITLDNNADVKWKSLPAILKQLELTNIKKPSTLLSNKKELIESASTSSLEILSDVDNDCVPDASPTNNGVLHRMLSAKSRLSKFGGTDFFSNVSHYVIFDKNHVIAFDTQSKKLSKFPAAVDYSFYPPKVGVDYESSTVLKPNIIENNHKACSLPIKEYYTSHGIQQYYVIGIDKKERLIEPETVVIDLIRKVVKCFNSKDTVALIVPTYFSEKQKNALLHSAHSSDFWNLELIDEQLELGYSLTKIAKKYFILVNCYETKAIISLFRKENEKCQKCIELNDIEKSGKNIEQFVEVVNGMMKDRMFSEMCIFVSRNKYIFTALRQFYLENSTLKLKFFENPEETLVKRESPDLLSLKLENITFELEKETKLTTESMHQKASLCDDYGSNYGCSSEKMR